MKKRIKICISAFLAVVMAIAPTSVYQQQMQKVSAAGNLLAFPGAVGAGRYATGGRGGEVYHVTNLNDSGTGSFRDAVSKSGRIVVFDVSGTIELSSNILVQSNITIAGQTAPGGAGITLKNYKMGMSGDNVICRFVSSRPGPYKATSSGNDAWGGAKGSNSIIDHCSMSWTTDEQWGLYSNNEYYTVQYSIIGPADSWGGHAKGLHGFGLMMGKGYSTFDHNLIIHNVSRNFRGKIEGTETADFTNNVIYNWAYQTAYGTIGHLNYVNNTLKMGNGTTGGKHYVNVDSTTKPQNFKIFLQGNRMLNKDNSVYDTVTSDNWNGIDIKAALTTDYGITKDTLKSSTSFQTTVNSVNVSTADTCESAEVSYEHVLDFAGNGISSNTRTAVDQQCAYEARTGTGNLSGTAAYDDATDANKTNIDKYHIECGVTYTYPSAVTQKTITDADNDGMDDEWEVLRGLNPNDPTDYKGDYCGMGYMNIEYYINDLTVNAFPEGIVELSPETSSIEYTSAFTQMEAENYSDQSGIRSEDTSDSVGVQNIGFIENGDYVLYKYLDFEEGANSFIARASGNACTMELYLDNLTGTPVASVSYSGSGSFSKWEDVSFNIPTIKGQHNLYIKFTGGEGYLMNLNYFKFSKDSIPVSGILGENLTVSDMENGFDWKFAENANVDSLIFGDRAFTITEMPTSLMGAEQILTACDSKSDMSLTANFKATKDILVSVAVDERVENMPSFLAGYTKTDMTMKSSNDVTFVIYQKNFNNGDTVELGSNGQSAYCVNYTIFLSETSEPIPTEPETTEPITEEPTTEEPTQPIPEPTDATTEPSQPASEQPVTYGDVDGDGAVSIIDVLTLNQYLLGIGDIETEYLENADVDHNGLLEDSDAMTILKYLVKLATF